MEDRLNIKHHQCSPTPSRFHGGLSCLGNAYSLCMLQHLSLFREGKGDAAYERQFGIKSLSHAHLPDSEGLSPEARFHGHSASMMGSKQSVPCRGRLISRKDYAGVRWCCTWMGKSGKLGSWYFKWAKQSWFHHGVSHIYIRAHIIKKKKECFSAPETNGLTS